MLAALRHGRGPAGKRTGRTAAGEVPKWNPAAKKSEAFLDNGARMRAIETLADLLDAQLPRKLAGDTPDGTIPVRLITSIPRRGQGARVQ